MRRVLGTRNYVVCGGMRADAVAHHLWGSTRLQQLMTKGTLCIHWLGHLLARVTIRVTIRVTNLLGRRLVRVTIDFCEANGL